MNDEIAATVRITNVVVLDRRCSNEVVLIKTAHVRPKNIFESVTY